LQELISVFFLMIIFGFSFTVDQIMAQVSTDCDRQTFSLVECPHKETNKTVNGDLKDIEEVQVMIPFP
jgi:hypothetical protein